MNFFNIDFAMLCKQLLPVRWRKVRQLAWVHSLTAPVVALFDTFTKNRTVNNYYIAHNGQVCHLEAVLNDRFDPTERRIEIHNGPICDPLYVFLTGEVKQVHIATETELLSPPLFYSAPSYLYTLGEMYNVGVTFRVYWPEDFEYTTDDTNEIHGLINKYRLVSRVNYELLDGPAPPLEV